MTESLKYFGNITINSESQIFDAVASINNEDVNLVLFNLTGKEFTGNQMTNLKDFLNDVTENANLSFKTIEDSFNQKTVVYDYIQLQKILLSESLNNFIEKCGNSISVEECLLSKLRLFEISIHNNTIKDNGLQFLFNYSIDHMEPALVLAMTKDKNFRILDIEE